MEEVFPTRENTGNDDTKRVYNSRWRTIDIGIMAGCRKKGDTDSSHCQKAWDRNHRGM